MDTEIRVVNAAGVTLALPIAGPGGRSYAFVIDWHIRVLLALTWALSFYALNAFGVRLAGFAYIAWIPAGLIYFLYHPVLEVLLRGSTPGKRRAGIRIVDEAGRPPSTGALLIRNLFRLVDTLPSLYVVGLTATLVTRQSVRLGDLAAGTLLIYDKTEPKLDDLSAFANGAGLTATQTELVQDVLERWDSLNVERRCEIGEKLLHKLEAEVPARNDSKSSNAKVLRQALGALLVTKTDDG